ncbi:MAG: glycerophosphodiester phosphodiesterase family protein [Balneolaceae bacterium]|nr:glycerophosphodiester phosphodiesterase family protein [Balneolaceae bacterium]
MLNRIQVLLFYIGLMLLAFLIHQPISAQNNTFHLQTNPEDIRAAWLDSTIPHIFVVAHRANTTYRDGTPSLPENSLKAVESAIRNGADVVEIDLKKTSDGYFVLMHDRDLGRTTNGSGPVSDKTLKELLELNLVHDGEVTQEKIPTLEEVLELVRGRALINLDHINPILEEVMPIVEELDMLDHAIIKTRNTPDEMIDRLKGLPMDEVLFMPIIPGHDYSDEELIDLISEYKEKLGITAVELLFNLDNAHRMTEELFRSIHNMGVRVWLNTLWNGRHTGGLADEDIPAKSDEVFGTLLKRGVTIIQTDQAAYLRSYITSPHYIQSIFNTNTQ